MFKLSEGCRETVVWGNLNENVESEMKKGWEEKFEEKKQIEKQQKEEKLKKI